MSRLHIRLDGTSALVCHNIRLADPDDTFTKEISALAKKRVKTDDDRKEMARLEWFGGLYTFPTIDGPAMPCANVRKCLIQAAKVRKQGTQVGRAVMFTQFAVPIIYDGPRDVGQLWEVEAFRYRASVGVNQARTMRMRPQFPAWRIECSVELLDDVMDRDDLARIVELAGLMEGLGDNRINGYGRFTGQLSAA